MKNKIHEEEEVTNVIDLNQAVAEDYFNNPDYKQWFVLDTTIKQPATTKSGKKVVSGKNKNGDTVIFYDNGIVKNIKKQRQRPWIFVQKTPTPEELKSKANAETMSANTANITAELERIGYTLKQPMVTDATYNQGKYVKDLEGGKYAKYFQPEQMVWPTRNLTDNIKDINIKELKQEMKSGQISRRLCRATIKTMYDALKNTGKQYYNNDTDLLLAKETLRKCDTQGKHFMKGLEKKLEVLKNTSAKVNRIGLAESTVDVETIIETKLFESIKTKKTLLKESEQVQKKLSYILVENDSIIDNLINEVNILRKSGFNEEIIQEGIGEMLSSLGSNAGGGIWSYFKQKAMSWLLAQFGVDPNSWAGQIVSQTFANIDVADYGKVFTDCKFTSAKLAEGITEAMVNKFKDSKGFDGPLYDMMAQTTAESLFNSDMVKNLETKLASFICPKLSSL